MLKGGNQENGGKDWINGEPGDEVKTNSFLVPISNG
jgi:hypothetical protein